MLCFCLFCVFNHCLSVRHIAVTLLISSGGVWCEVETRNVAYFHIKCQVPEATEPVTVECLSSSSNIHLGLCHVELYFITSSSSPCPPPNPNTKTNKSAQPVCSWNAVQYVPKFHKWFRNGWTSNYWTLACLSTG